MKVEINVVPPGGGETNYTIPLAENSYFMPRAGEYINIREEDGMSAFYVRNIHYFCEKPQTKFLVENVVIEAEPVLLPEGIGSEGHNKVCLSMQVSKEYPTTIY
ncbi:hypothetical protein [Paenisporosarcina sp. OV554]|uniref:hypothetical protein n=1 Tax=Paenisporosarcina sp. OV554 TaxID=2135694 RepID=UPI000D3562C9|nr:hypothetical protein [Paenisporosarcina sp. OV554]PUB12632.1 hypothetical protein C8K15_109131 [Paenisporosarcina sp. OV554]